VVRRGRRSRTLAAAVTSGKEMVCSKESRSSKICEWRTQSMVRSRTRQQTISYSSLGSGGAGVIERDVHRIQRPTLVGRQLGTKTNGLGSLPVRRFQKAMHWKTVVSPRGGGAGGGGGVDFAQIRIGVADTWCSHTERERPGCGLAAARRATHSAVPP